MIVYKGILAKLAAAGYNTVRLQKEHLISNGSIIQIRAGRPITTVTINTICRLCRCQPGDIMEYRDDEERE